MQEGRPLQAPRTEIGLRLLLASLILAILTTVVSPLIYTLVVSGLSSDPSRALSWHTIVIPGIALALGGALGLTGVVAFLILEWNRGRRTDSRRRALDGTRVAAIVSLVAGAFLIGSGIVSGFVYVGAFWVGAGIHAALWLTLALSAGLFLFWTAGQIGPTAIRLRQLALALGVASATLSGATMAVSLLGGMSTDPMVGGILGVTASAMGTSSLLTWIVVYAGVLAKYGSRGQASVVSAHA